MAAARAAPEAGVPACAGAAIWRGGTLGCGRPNSSKYRTEAMTANRMIGKANVR
jgi:hypothetical protein